MNRTHAIKLVPALILLASFTIVAQTGGGWGISPASNGYTLTLPSPATYLRIEQQLQLQIDNQGTPQRGNVKYLDGVERELTLPEASYYWEYLGGAHDWWQYMETQGKVTSVHPQSASIPDNFFGKTTRVMTISGKELYGKMQKSLDLPNGFMLASDGACCGPVRFEKGTVTLLEQVR